MSVIAVLKVARLTTALVLSGAACLTHAQEQDRGVRLRQQASTVTYDIELVRGAQRALVPVTYEFQTGDRFALRMKVAAPSYVYVLNRTFNGDPVALRSNRQIRVASEPNGPPYVLIYPVGANRLLAAGGVNLIPGPGQLLEMDENAGVEKLLVIVSPRPIDLTRYFDANTGKLRSGASGGSELNNSSQDSVLAKLNTDLSGMANNSEVEEVSVPARLIEFVPLAKHVVPGRTSSVPDPKKGKPSGTESRVATTPPNKPAGLNVSSVAAPKRATEPYLVEITLSHVSK